MRIPKPSPLLVALAGPSLIIAAVILVLHDFVFGGRFTNLNPDVPTVFLANHCFLGESLADGVVPLWNRFPMLGVPFAADPQSGWMYLPAMFLYTLLPCSIAIRAFIVLQPLLAGIGVFWLLREEKLSRAAATAGGLVLALAISASKILVTIPFSDTLAWTAILLPSVGRLLRSRSWSARLLWTAVVAVAWGQLASAHLSHGLVIGTTSALFYGIHVARIERREGRLSARSVAAIVVVLACALPLVNLAHLLPVAGYVGRATLGAGYDELQRVAAGLRGDPIPALTVNRALGAIWPLRFSTAPGLYLGALPLMLMSAGFVARRTRGLALTFGLLGALFYVAGMERVIAAIAPRIQALPFSDFYRHSSGRFMYGALFAWIVVAATGIDAWRDAVSWKERAAMVAPGAIVWGALPFAAGVIPTRMALFAVGVVAAVVLLVVTARRPALAWAIPVVLSVELSAGAIGGQIAGYRLAKDGLETATDSWLPFRPLPEPTLSAAGYIEGGPIEDAVGDESSPDDGRLLMMGEGLTWLFRPLLSGVEMPQGYNPVQLDRYWRFVRSLVDERLRYNMSIFPTDLPSIEALDLMQVGWVASEEPLPILGAETVARDERRILHRIQFVAPRASVVTDWEIAEGDAALEHLTGAGFDPSAEVVVERDPGLGPSDGPETDGPDRPEEGRASFRWTSANTAVVSVESAAPGIVLIRNAHDENWTATVDGAPADVIVADYFLQGVPIEAGEHTLELRYVESSVYPGLAGTGLTLVVLLAMATVLRVRERRVQL